MTLTKYSQLSKDRSKSLRKNMTDAELMLWRYLRKRQIKNLQFYRQKPLGKYIVDFYCPAKKIVIEVDGGQHYEDSTIDYDNIRTQFLENTLGLKVIRFTNIDVLINIESVLERIYQSTR